MYEYWNKPCAAQGLSSYRYPLTYSGWIMIGATDTADALREANRSLIVPNADVHKLEVWDQTEKRYVPVQP